MISPSASSRTASAGVVRLRCAAMLAVAALAAACTGGPSAGVAGAPSVARSAPTGDLIAQLRSAGETGVELDVQPLRDPQVQDLRATATAAESRRDFGVARAAIDKAIELSPADPDLLQWRAELALQRHEFAVAEQLARTSYETGPKVGGLCRRNWTTILIAAQARDDAMLAGQARQQAAGCKVAPPVRM